jgi:hypothetical protein
MTIQFCDYSGPTGLSVATGKTILPLASPAGAAAFVGGAIQSGIGDADDSAAVQVMVGLALEGVAARS